MNVRGAMNCSTIVYFRITWTRLICPKELRFPTVPEVHRDSEIARTDGLSTYFDNSLYKRVFC